jgi:hypothetical protein
MSNKQGKTPVISMRQFRPSLILINFIYLIVDTDPGVDDTIAMLFFVVPPQDSLILTEIIAFWRLPLQK